MNMLEVSLEAEPSTPRPTLTPVSSISRILAMPWPQRMLAEGQCATPVPVSAKRLISSDVMKIECANQTSGPSQPTDSANSTDRMP